MATSSFEIMGSQLDAAGVIFNLPGYPVVEEVDLPLCGRRQAAARFRDGVGRE